MASQMICTECHGSSPNCFRSRETAVRKEPMLEPSVRRLFGYSPFARNRSKMPNNSFRFSPRNSRTRPPRSKKLARRLKSASRSRQWWSAVGKRVQGACVRRQSHQRSFTETPYNTCTYMNLSSLR
jgi:hypothetical protein